MNERYAESIIRDRACDYDGIEIHGVRDLAELNDQRNTCCEIDDENPQYFSTYVHLKEGGVECVGDFATHDLAREYAGELARQYQWKVWDYSPPPYKSPEPPAKKPARGLGM